MEHKQINDSTPSSGRNPLVEKVRNCDGTFRFLSNISTPPSRMFKIRNPFESPLLERLHLPVCSPGLFSKSTPKKEEKFMWSICDISNLKPAEIDTRAYQENISTVFDPQKESLIQDKISSFFKQNAIVPSPAPRENTERRNSCLLPLGGSPDEGNSLKIKSSGGAEESAMETSKDEEEYLPEEEYYKQLFDFKSETRKSSDSSFLLDSPVQFSPPKALVAKSSSDEMDKKKFKECGLSPISSENGKTQHENSKSSSRELKSVCRLMFSEDEVSMQNSFEFNPHKDISFESTVIESEMFLGDMSDENGGLMSIDEVFEESDYETMDISLVHTPKTGLFTSQRKRLSDSFKDLPDKFLQFEESQVDANFVNTKSRLLSEGSSDMGYHSANVQPSISEKTWNNSHVFSSTPTKRK